MLLKPTPICSSKFSFSNNIFTAEASDLNHFKLGRVYDDSCDEGFTIISKKTGKGAVFCFDRREDDVEGDILYWIFKCVTPGLTHLKAVIYND